MREQQVKVSQEKYRQAAEMRHAGFSNKVEATGLENEVKQMILEYHWSPQQIANELAKKHPELSKEQLPSYKSIERFRDKHLPSSKVYNYPGATRKVMEGICQGFNSYKQLVKIALKSMERMNLASEFEKKTLMPSKERTVIFEDALRAVDVVLGREIEMGLRPKAVMDFSDLLKPIKEEDYGELSTEQIGEKFERTYLRFREIFGVKIGEKKGSDKSGEGDEPISKEDKSTNGESIS